jgi:hypothetical protein
LEAGLEAGSEAGGERSLPLEQSSSQPLELVFEVRFGRRKGL